MPNPRHGDETISVPLNVGSETAILWLLQGGPPFPQEFQVDFSHGKLRVKAFQEPSHM